MAEPAPRAWTVDAFFAWQERQPDRYELVGGFPLEMMVGVRNVHDRIVVNVIAELRNQLRGKSCRPFTGESAVETFPGQIRRPDAGVDCGHWEPNGFKAADPRVVLEVLSPGTLDFDTIEKIAEYKAVESLGHIVYVEPDEVFVVHWTKGVGRAWERRDLRMLEDAVALPDLGVTLRLDEIYDGVSFPPPLRPIGAHPAAIASVRASPRDHDR